MMLIRPSGANFGPDGLMEECTADRGY
jgi:hypothetical protein